MDPMGSLLLLRPWMGYDYIVIQVVCWVELPGQRRLCSIFFFLENMDPDKWDTTVWYRVTQNPQEFHGLTGYQQDPRIWGVTAWYQSLGKRLPKELECGYPQVWSCC